MILPSGRLQFSYSDSRINALLRDSAGGDAPYTSHFSQNEDFFVRLPEEIEVPSFAIHHDADQQKPDAELTDVVRDVVRQIHAANATILGGLTHLFDFTSKERPAFFRLFRANEITYLYLLRVDLEFRAMYGSMIERATNTATPRYRTRNVFLESDLFPLSSLETSGSKIRSMQLEQSVSNTWIGETGRGYMRAGMWLDRDLTKFFSRLFAPRDRRIYPYFPLTCKYRTVAHSVVGLTEELRRKSVQFLDRTRRLLLPHIPTIETALRSVAKDGFRDDLPAFKRILGQIREQTGSDWGDPWKNFSMRMYLNEEEQREFELEHGLF